MQAIVLEENAHRRSEIAQALSQRGFDVACMATIPEAKAYVRGGFVDLVVTAEAAAGRLAHDVALLAEWRNPLAASILLSDREGEAADELHLLIPSLHAVLPPDAPARTLAQVALSAVRHQGEETAEARLDRLWAEAEGLGGADDGDAVANIFAVPAGAGTGLPSFLRDATHPSALTPLILFDPILAAAPPPAARAPVERRLHLA